MLEPLIDDNIESIPLVRKSAGDKAIFKKTITVKVVVNKINLDANNLRKLMREDRILSKLMQDNIW
ncbi:hypothetical protein [Bacillus nitratireducens]|uniref:hypothetical protein n=1 Tax=Bacillus nitratireducens TaxID=2026193 RepID=UPI000BEC6209|nr:hypothetical protein [Bacillus nitratireducens]PEE14964.1 hypothetical protein CON53_27120 [Bacillus cereus]MED0906771.1 hypothetical protein [Bacillus nitratireducens]PFH80361.1 hypothetical protein COI81_30075 [Bacillus cereus]PFM45700.1 hypothetical protein COJ52_30480 [Bacillus cereus]PFR99927.1 hypothetical protein COK55_32370 [Bacillus cereus]